jgi:hypothetical protein
VTGIVHLEVRPAIQGIRSGRDEVLEPANRFSVCSVLIGRRLLCRTSALKQQAHPPQLLTRTADSAMPLVLSRAGWGKCLPLRFLWSTEYHPGANS